MSYRIEKDTLGEVQVPMDRYWGAQTQRSVENFKTGPKMPIELIRALALLKKAAAAVSCENNGLSIEKSEMIGIVVDEILAGKWDDHFPLVVYQTGSGTQTNMNVNEVIANRGNERLGKKLLHPNDDVNRSQSSNDTFPSAMHMAAVMEIQDRLFPVMDQAITTLERLEQENQDNIKCARTHLQDATPIRFSQEISAWREMLCQCKNMLQQSLPLLYPLAIGGTAVGTGLNAPSDFGDAVAKKLSEWTQIPFTSATNKFHSQSSKDGLVAVHGNLKALATDLMKMANDIRWLASGPRNGLGEITIPANEPGSSIMPGKVNPTQVEALTMVVCRVFGNDATITMGASQGNFQLNVYMPVIIDSFLESVRLLTQALSSFDECCLSGIRAVPSKMQDNVDRSLMLVTALNPIIGYEKAAILAKFAWENDLTLKEANRQLDLLPDDSFDLVVQAEKML